MKIRASFVTNSSSSSFIITRELFNSIDEVYTYVRELYLEYLDKLDYAIEYTKSNPDCGWEYSNDGYFYILNRKEKTYKDLKNIRKIFKGVTSLDWFDVDRVLDSEWTDCVTYEQYEKYFLDKKYAAPFTIGDYLNKTITWLHWGKKTENLNTGLGNDELEWYWEDIDNPKKYTYEDKESTKMNLCYEFLGRFCIYSESGYIPSWIVSELGRISKYWCNHMG